MNLPFSIESPGAIVNNSVSRMNHHFSDGSVGPISSSGVVVSGSTSSFASSMYGLHVKESVTTHPAAPSKGRNHSYYSAEVLADGYRYKKYGQKFSKSSNYPTCYFRCAQAGCPVKRQISRSDDGKIINNYRGSHNHVPPQMRKVRVLTQSEFISVAREEGKFLGSWENTEHTRAETERKLVVTAAAGIDPTDDSFLWRKYGSKTVKGSTVNKSYYRCAASSCSAKRLVQRAVGAGEEAQVVYQGAHNHALPARTTPASPPRAVTSTITPLLSHPTGTKHMPAAPDSGMPMGILPNGQRVMVMPSTEVDSAAVLYSTGMTSLWADEGPGGLGMGGLGGLPDIPSL